MWRAAASTPPRWRSGAIVVRPGARRADVLPSDADAAANSVVTILLDGLDAHVAVIAARGREPDERLTYSNGVRKTLYRDADGNELGFGGPRATSRDKAG
jgi:hypothetical protein